VTARRRALVAFTIGAALIALAAFSLRTYGEYLNTPHYTRHSLPIDGYKVVSETELEISVHTGALDIVEEPSVREEPGRITISAAVSEYNPGSGFKTLVRDDYQVRITLKSAFGERQVIDGATGRPIPRT
jgi:hypothetical protein